MFKSYCGLWHRNGAKVDAYTRFIVQGGKSKKSNAENSGSSKEEPEPAVPQQAQLRKAGNNAEKTRPKLGLNHSQFSHNILS